MLAHRVIPVLLMRGTQLVKGVRFQSWRSIGHALQAARIHASREVDEMILLDIAASPEGRRPNFDLVEHLARDCFMPLTVGGGIRNVEDVRELLRRGADKVAICTSMFHSDILEEASRAFGRQAIVAAIDARDGWIWSECGKQRWRLSPQSFAWNCAIHGAGEILLTSIDRDGTLEGYDLDLIRAVSSAVSIPVIANGGAGTYEHMREAIEAGASAVAAGAMFAWTDATPKGAAEYLKRNGIEARV